MLSLPPSIRIFVALAPTGMRKQFDGLSIEVRRVIEQDPLSGHLLSPAISRNRKNTGTVWPPSPARDRQNRSHCRHREVTIASS